MSRYTEMFEHLKSKGEGAFVPFVVLGDPGIALSREIIQTMIDAGADALELGFPFSDPLADGPVIQDAMDRALRAKVTPADCFELIKQVRATNANVPIGLLVYANIVFSFGVVDFYNACRDAGVDSVLIADVPVSESAPFREAANACGVDPILLCPPNIDDTTLQQVASLGCGYTYLLSRSGVTGTNVAAGVPVEQLLEKLESLNAPAPLLGFGISQPNHVSLAIQAGAKGVIVGSAIVKIIEKGLRDGESSADEMQAELSKFVSSMKSATQRN